MAAQSLLAHCEADRAKLLIEGKPPLEVAVKRVH